MATRTGDNSTKHETAGGYTVLARRYRSRDFDEIIGQEPIARTLANAVASGRTAHAYLFTGTRGVGKTSMARIFAKALNATDDLTQKDEIADAILRGEDLDVIEIDGASNRGIADAKDLIAGAGLSPARCRYKIYIIDEVHALTKDAFNALLKTMEEPPAHVKFILCTTEANKVPQTIQSRCQRFDFRPIPTARIADQLRMILEKERIKADDDVIMQVAQLGNGSMRDALSLLDRLLAVGDDALTGRLIEQILGLPDHALIVQLVQAIIDSDPKQALSVVDELTRRGATIEQMLEMLAKHFRGLMIVATCGEDSTMLEVSAEQRQVMIEHAKHFDAAALVHLIALCDAVNRNARASAAGRALLDAAVVRMAMAERFMDIDAAVQDSGPSSARMSASKVESKKKADLPRKVSEVDRAPASSASAAPLLTEVKPHAQECPPNQDADTADADAIWAKILQHASQREMARVTFEHLVLDSFEGSTMKLRIADHGADMAKSLHSRIDSITSTVQQVAGSRVRVELIESSEEAPLRGDESGVNPAAEEARDLPLVRQAMDIFDASIISVQEATPDSPRAAPREKGDVNV